MIPPPSLGQTTPVSAGPRAGRKDDRAWRTLYKDPDAGDFWELDYPHAQMHGGGPPRLTRVTRVTRVTPEVAKQRHRELK